MAVGLGVLVFMNRGTDEDKSEPPEQPTKSASNPEPSAELESKPAESKEPEKVLTESTCPSDVGSNCVVASGRVIYEEKVDPDGDGDAHFVTASTDSITGPGITIFDVRTDLRPDPLPGVGDLVGGAGPVFPGHAGQKQMEVIEFHVAHRE
ncbi:MAG: hypothetical protein JJE13_05845 [Thermoleophilia bacterium]|nr:hypothetical protein [Thermoleophilia bacterium]